MKQSIHGGSIDIDARIAPETKAAAHALLRPRHKKEAAVLEGMRTERHPRSDGSRRGRMPPH